MERTPRFRRRRCPVGGPGSRPVRRHVDARGREPLRERAAAKSPRPCRAAQARNYSGFADRRRRSGRPGQRSRNPDRRGQAPFRDRMAGNFAAARGRRECRCLAPAAVGGPRAARMEGAARRRIERIRHLAGDGRARHAGHLQVGNRFEQHPRVRVLRRAEQPPRRRELDDPPQVHDADAVGDMMDDREVVRDEQVGQAHPARQVPHQVQHLRLHRHVERRRRLVADQEAWFGRQRAGDGNALPLPAGKLVRVLAAVGGGEPDLLEQRGDARGDVGARRARLLREDRLGDDVVDAPARVEAGVGILEDHLHRPPRGTARLGVGAARARAGDHGARIGDRPAGRRVEADDQPRDGGLAAA